GEKLLAPARKFGAPLADTIAPISYVHLNSLLDDAVPYGGVQRYWKSSFLRQLSDDVLNIMIDKAEGMRSPMSMVGFFHVHGACTRIDRDATAYSSRANQLDYATIS